MRWDVHTMHSEKHWMKRTGDEKNFESSDKKYYYFQPKNGRIFDAERVRAFRYATRYKKHKRKEHFSVQRYTSDQTVYE